MTSLRSNQSRSFHYEPTHSRPHSPRIQHNSTPALHLVLVKGGEEHQPESEVPEVNQQSVITISTPQPSLSRLVASISTSRTIVNDAINPRPSNVTSGALNVTLVSAYIDIGQFGKGNPNNRRDHKIYETWSRPFGKIVAPFLFFTDSPNFARHMRHVRANLSHLTQIVHVNRSRLWAFQQRKAIARIYAGNYPKHWPNTVYPDYTCLTHAKFDFLMEALEASRFPPTPHVAWIDVGYLRDVVSAPYPAFYTLRPPPAFNASRVLCGEVNRPTFQQPWQSIFRGNLNWVAGGFFLAVRDVMKAFVLQYRRAVTTFLQHNESNVEQHVLYAMYTDSGRALVKPEVEFQLVSSPAWFDVGYLCLQGQNISTMPPDNRNLSWLVAPRPDQTMQELVLYWDGPVAEKTESLHDLDRSISHLQRGQSKNVEKPFLVRDGTDTSETTLLHSNSDNQSPLQQVQPKTIQELVLQWNDSDTSEIAVPLISAVRREEPETKPRNTVATHSSSASFHLSAPNVTFSSYDVTLVSAYIDLEEFIKEEPTHGRHNLTSETWFGPFSKILAPLIFFTDSPSFAEDMRLARANLSHLTQIVHVNRSRLWAFQQREAIAQIYAGNYPKHWPNTVYPDYTCLTHAKFDFLMKALEASRFPPTPHLAWMDVGYLRDVVSAPYPAFYTLRPPPAFNASRVLCGEVNRPKFQQPWQSIFRENSNWVAGVFFLAARDVMKAFVLQYRRAVTTFLQHNESNVEQHVLYAMYTDSGRALVKPEVEFQVVSSPSWFDVGYLCLRGQNVSSVPSS